MGSRCTIGNHGNCTGCDSFIPATQRDHVHIFRASKNTYDILCYQCWLTTAVAGSAVLRAIHEAGFNFASYQALHDFLKSNVIIGIQSTHLAPPPSLN